MDQIDQWAQPYSTILCDIWGVLHDGRALFPGAAERLGSWKGQGKRVILVTNAPRPAATVIANLDRLGLPRSSYDAVTSSGAAGIAALQKRPAPIGFLGTQEDRADLLAAGINLTDDAFADVACTGLPFDIGRGDPEAYRPLLAGWAARNVLFHCLNPDRVAIHHGRREACAGALADIYEEIGGKVCWYGKPHAPIYEHALSLAGDPERSAVLAIGDSLATDMLGAASFGIDALFVSHGIHEGEPFPADFAARNGLGEWHPVGTVSGLA